MASNALRRVLRLLLPAFLLLLSLAATMPGTAPPQQTSEHRWVANPTQRKVLDFIKAVPEEEYALVGYGGAAGGAKTNLLANLAINISLGCPGARTLIGRNELVHLRTTTLEEFDKCLPPGVQIKKLNGPIIARQLRHPDWPQDVWSTVFFQGVKNARDSIGSEEFGWVLLDEAHDIAETDLRYLFSRLRHKPERKRGMVICFNPFPCTAVEWFMNGTGLPEDMEALGVVHMTYVPARIKDNPHLPPNYEAMMGIGMDPYLLAVLVEGRAEAVPNAIFGSLNDPAVSEVLIARNLPEPWQWRGGATGWDWGTSKTHLSAGVLGGIDNHGEIWIVDAWESPHGSSTELKEQAELWVDLHFPCRTARYDASQGSLRDDLITYFPDTDKGIRDVEGRIRTGRGLVAQQTIHFYWRSEGVRKLWRYLTLYHRDDLGRIVEEKDDMIDAFFYMLWALVHPTPVFDGANNPPAQPVTWGTPESPARLAQLANREQRFGERRTDQYEQGGI